ncbi:MAG: hypothetical protein MK212_05495 [Saprospiraceae bacterium]|nr:hypothetical protein [Saprospiraceae bacterium]
MNCKRCKHPIKEEDHYCSNCGYPLHIDKSLDHPVKSEKDIKTYENAIERLEMALNESEKGRYLIPRKEGFSLFLVGSSMSILLLLQLIAQLLPYRVPFIDIVWWFNSLTVILISSIPLAISFFVKQQYRKILQVTGVFIIILTLIKIIRPYL